MLSPKTHRKLEKELQDYCSPLCPCVLPRNLARKTWDPEGGQGKVLGDLPLSSYTKAAQINLFKISVFHQTFYLKRKKGWGCGASLEKVCTSSLWHQVPKPWRKAMDTWLICLPIIFYLQRAKFF